MSKFEEFDRPIKYLITKGNLTKTNYKKESVQTLKIINNAIENKISFIQIREKTLPAKYICKLTKEAVKLSIDSKTKVLVNDRIDIAYSSNADGVHLTSTAIPTDIIRKISPKNFIIGVSTHNLNKALKAKNEGADFVTFSPVFPTISKKTFGKAKGLYELKMVCEVLSPFPVLALGGVDEDNYRSTITNGAIGFAGISFFNDLKRLESVK